MGIYANPDLLEWFQGEYPKYSKYKLNMGKSCIRFKKMTDDDLELFQRIIEYTGKNYPKSEFYGRMNAKKK